MAERDNPKLPDDMAELPPIRLQELFQRHIDQLTKYGVDSFMYTLSTPLDNDTKAIQLLEHLQAQLKVVSVPWPSEGSNDYLEMMDVLDQAAEIIKVLEAKVGSNALAHSLGVKLNGDWIE